MLALLHQHEDVKSIVTSHIEREGVALATATIIIDVSDSEHEHKAERIVSATSGEPIQQRRNDGTTRVDSDAWAKAETFALKRAIRMLGIACDIDGKRGLRMPDGRYIINAFDAAPTPFDDRIAALTTPDEHNALIAELRAGKDTIDNAAAIAGRVLGHGKELGLAWDNDSKSFVAEGGDNAETTAGT